VKVLRQESKSSNTGGENADAIARRMQGNEREKGR